MKTIPMKIKFLGGAREVGRAAVAVKSEKTQLLLDYGVMLDNEPGFPMHVPPKEVDGKNVWKWATGEALQTRSYATCIFYPWLWTQDGENAYMTDIEGTEERLYDIRKDPKQHVDIASSSPDLCKVLKKRI